VTEHPVEAEPGLPSVVSDNVRIDPVRLAIDGVVTDTPVTLLGFADAAQAVADSGDYDPSGDAYRDLKDALTFAESVTVVTSLETYDNMAFTSLSVTRNKGKSNAIYFRAELQQVRKVTLREEEVAVRLPKKSKKTTGKKVAKKKTEEEAGLITSVHKAVDGYKETGVWFK